MTFENLFRENLQLLFESLVTEIELWRKIFKFKILGL